MVWPFSSNGDNGGSKTELDPTLQEFVRAQGPVSYSTTHSQQQDDSPLHPSTQTKTPKPPQSGSDFAQTAVDGASAPPEPPIPTLFPDGRYAHLWKTYRSKASIEDTMRTTAEKTTDMLVAFRDRDDRVRKAGLENCVAENIALTKCNTGPPTAHDRVTMCRDYTRRLERCWVTQVRFLRALGYLTEPGRAAEEEEDIQLHADDLFRRMMAQEKMVADAKAEGRPVPVFASILASEASRAAGATPVIVGTRSTADGGIVSPTLDDAEDSQDNPALPPDAALLNEKVKVRMRERLKKLSADERAIERLAMATEIRETSKAGALYSEMALKQKAEREARRQAGTASIGDWVSKWLGW